MDGKFDLIVFNPPYLPKDKREPLDSQIITTGGKEGNEIINKFIRQSKKHLGKKGVIFLLVSSYTGKINFGSFREKIVKKKNLFFETISVLELKN